MITLEDDGRALYEAERNALRTFVAAYGLARFSERVKVSESAITRAIAELPIKRVTVNRLREALAEEGYQWTPPIT